MKRLLEAKKHDKIARAGWSQEPLTQATYDKKNALGLFVRDVKLVQEPMDDGRQHDAHHGDQRESAVERV